MRKPGRKALYWMMATLTIALIPQLTRMPIPVLFFAIAPLVWRLLSETRGWKPPRGLIKHGLTMAALATLFVSFGNLSGRSAAVSLLAVMLSLKLMECYRIRDARLLISFCLFLAATQFLFDQGILMPIYGVTVVATALIALSCLQRNEAWANQGEPPQLRVSLWAELGFSMRMLGLALPITLAFFVLFPRLPSPLWGIPDTTLDSQTGLSDSMSPGSIQNLFMDDSPAFRVTFDGAVPDNEDLYWRGPVFWNYDGRTWKPGWMQSRVPAPVVSETSQNSWDYTVQLEPNERKWLFSLDYPVQAPADSTLTADYQIIRRKPVLQLTEYQLVSNPNHRDAVDLPATFRMAALDLPEDLNPRTLQLVKRWRQQFPDDVSLINHALQFFNTESFYYSLEAPLLGINAVDEFLFDTRMGYCEHYSSSFAVVMRMAGIPARIVTGYLGGWYSPLGEYMLVRQSDAHAWVEVWLHGEGWSRIDPTSAVSPSRIRQGSLGAIPAPRHVLDFSWLRTTRNSIDIVQQRWNDWVIDYGANRQARLLSPFGMTHLAPSTLIALLGVVIAILAVVILPFVMRIKGPASRTPVQKIWVVFLKKLKSLGVEPLPSAGPNEIAAQASAHVPAFSQEFTHISGLYRRYRYSSSPPALQDLKQAVKAFDPKKRS